MRTQLSIEKLEMPPHLGGMHALRAGRGGQTGGMTKASRSTLLTAGPAFTLQSLNIISAPCWPRAYLGRPVGCHRPSLFDLLPILFKAKVRAQLFLISHHALGDFLGFCRKGCSLTGMSDVVLLCLGKEPFDALPQEEGVCLRNGFASAHFGQLQASSGDVCLVFFLLKALPQSEKQLCMQASAAFNRCFRNPRLQFLRHPKGVTRRLVSICSHPSLWTSNRIFTKNLIDIHKPQSAESISHPHHD